jgi:hypothetical protein
LNNPQPYIDNSLTLGAFIYHGNANLSAVPSVDKFTMGGGDFNAYYDRWNLFGGVGLRHDEHPYTDPASLGLGANTTVFFTELDVVAYPWLLPGVRFESWKSEDADGAGGTASYTDNQIVPGVVFLVRPNVKFTLRTSFEKDSRWVDSKYELGQVQFLLAVGI